ncbi:DNA-directed RNA polymerase subunit alpha C-terminal domain-containing protein [Bosea sp. ANAM02]|uniref:DNA-directed RNA polymerase subunit alpha C-terminal domain-containing protein n=1 Tax=Bosea sp. ANAM02 TaxID=2020412 RepID=UPI00140EF768|nr:DNA-directed RNA polymerase subunit alpha C-terminal domain-containing protein [Bosea sp. ANAM02]BCB22104.1 hypothetical protein OCUBac02_49980 [Bosea sp. ANAM02]
MSEERIGASVQILIRILGHGDTVRAVDGNNKPITIMGGVPSKQISQYRLTLRDKPVGKSLINAAIAKGVLELNKYGEIALSERGRDIHSRRDKGFVRWVVAVSDNFDEIRDAYPDGERLHHLEWAANAVAMGRMGPVPLASLNVGRAHFGQSISLGRLIDKVVKVLTRAGFTERQIEFKPLDAEMQSRHRQQQERFAMLARQRAAAWIEVEEAIREQWIKGRGRELCLPVSNLELSERSMRTLAGSGIEVIGDLVKSSEKEILQLKGVGIGALREIKMALADKRLHLGMALEEWQVREIDLSKRAISTPALHL